MSASNSQSDDSEQVNFGYQKVSAAEKTERVGEVFRAVARRYDVMNDIMSLGSHRIFKRMVLHMSGVRSGGQVLTSPGYRRHGRSICWRCRNQWAGGPS